MHAMMRISSGGAPRITHIDQRVLELKRRSQYSDKLEQLTEDYFWYNAHGLELCMTDQDVEDLIELLYWLDMKIELLNKVL